MFENLSGLQIVLLGAAGVAAYFFWFKPGFDPAMLFACLKEKFLGVKKAVEDKVDQAGKPVRPTRVEVVEKWEKFVKTLEDAGLHEAAEQANEMWNLLNEDRSK